MAGIGSNKQCRGEHHACDNDCSPGSDDDNATTDYVDYTDAHDGFDYDVAADDSDGNSHLHPQERNGRKQGKIVLPKGIFLREVEGETSVIRGLFKLSGGIRAI